MNLEAPIRELSRQLAEQLAHRTMELLAEAQAEINRLQAELAEQTRLRLETEQELGAERQRSANLSGCLEQERQQRQRAEQEVQTIHAAIAAQLEVAEAEEQRQQEREAEQRRQWREQQELQLREQLALQLREQLEAQRTAWLQERAQREALELRIARFRSAAGDLLALELGSAPIAPLSPQSEGLSLAWSN